MRRPDGARCRWRLRALGMLGVGVGLLEACAGTSGPDGSIHADAGGTGNSIGSTAGAAGQNVGAAGAGGAPILGSGGMAGSASAGGETGAGGGAGGVAGTRGSGGGAGGLAGTHGDSGSGGSVTGGGGGGAAGSLGRGGNGGGGGGGDAGSGGSAAGSGGFGAAGKSGGGGGCNLPATVSFQKDVQPFLSTTCGGGSCHVIDAASTVSMGGYDHAYDWITAHAHPSSCPNTPTPERFEVVIAVIDAANPSSCSKSRIMPPQNETGSDLRKPLTVCQIATLQAWLDEPLVTQAHRVDDTDPTGTPPYPMPPFN